MEFDRIFDNISTHMRTITQLREGFTLLINLCKIIVFNFWQRRRDLKPQHADYASAALTTLKYVITDSYLTPTAFPTQLRHKGDAKWGTFERDMGNFKRKFVVKA